jgi:CubicO group peptidase (beta-lactamase class C family)
MKTAILAWSAPAVLIVAAAAVFAGEPLFWKRYVLSAIADPADRAAALGEPREAVAGSLHPPLPRVPPEAENVDPAALQMAADYAATRGANALLVGRRGHLVYEKYWNGTDVDALVIADGFAGTIAAIMVGFAIDDGAVGSLHEPAARHLTEWQGDARSTITVRDLLHMSSGLAPPPPGSLPWSESVRWRLGTDIVAEHLAAPLTGRPGRDWNPHAGDTQRLGILLERATRQRYARYVADKLWKPLGAADASVTLDRPGGNAHLGCCFSARHEDWMRLGDALARHGVHQGEQVIPAGWVRAMRTPSVGNVRYGFHLWLGDDTYAVDDVLHLDGGTAGLWVAPSLELVILSTGSAPDAHLPNLVIRGLGDYVPKPVRTPVDDPARYVPGH